VLPNLATQISGMGLDKGLTRDLTGHLADATRKLDPPLRACGDLDGFVQQVFDEAGGNRPGLTIAQAKKILATVSSVEGSIGCDDGDAAIPKARAEQDVLGLIDTVNGMSLDNGLAGDLRGKLVDVGRQLAGDPTASACHGLADLTRQIDDRSGKPNGLTAAQAATLKAAGAAIAAELGCG
jgi:hypothetical protein